MLSMSSVLLLSFLALPKCLAVGEDALEQYLTQRQEIINEESSDLFGADIILDDEEQAANEVLMKLKQQEIGTAANSRNFLPSKPFSSVSKAISNSPLFKVIRLMPKGGVLHAHLSAVNSRNFILNNITDRENLYVCRDQRDGAPRLRFLRYGAAAATSRVDRSCRWRLLAEVRRKDRSIDEEIDQALTMYASGDRLGRISNSNDAWRKFLNVFDFVKSLFSFKPVYEDYLYHVLEEMYKDNVQFVELRTALQPLYDLDGQQYQDLQVLEIFKKVVDRFMDDHADFVAVKIIYSPHRNIPRSTLDEYIGKFRLFQEAYPELVVGFDLVGQEDRGRPLLDFVDELLELGRDTRFYFHAGETNWNGHEVDENLIDAILLNAKRIGHGFALIKHPKLMEIVKEKKIVVEVSPISNQVLKLVGDMRNHPAAHFFATNLPVVISNDDPGFWGARGLSHDYYEAFVGIMSRKTDLRSLKRLALNSIEHSSLSDKERALAEEAWTRRWKTFVRQIMNVSDDRETLSSSYYRYEIQV